MKVAIVSCGLLDVILPLVRYLALHAEVDLYISVHGKAMNDPMGTFHLEDLPYGLIDEQATEKVLGTPLTEFTRNKHKNVRIRLYRYPSLKILNRQNFILNRNLSRYLNGQHYDVIHFNGFRGSLLFIYSFLNSRPGKVWTIHDPVQHSGEFRWPTEVGYRLFRYLKVKIIIHNSIQLPEFVKKYHLPPGKCYFIRFGPLEVFRIFKNGSTIAPGPQNVLFYGRISPYKGVEYLVEAAKKARESLPQLKVVIAGKPNYPIDLDSIRNDPTFEIHDRFIPNHELVDLVENSRLVVCPYTDATQSGVIMTAYAFHKPVLATSVGGIPEMVEDGKTGKLIPPKDSEALAEALVELLDNDNEIVRMEQSIKNSVDSGKFSWTRIAADTIKVYQDSLKI